MRPMMVLAGMLMAMLIVVPGSALAEGCNGEACLQECTTGIGGPVCSPVFCGSQPEGACSCEVMERTRPSGVTIRVCTTDGFCGVGCNTQDDQGDGFPRPLTLPPEKRVVAPYFRELAVGVARIPDTGLQHLIGAGYMKHQHSFRLGVRDVHGASRPIPGKTFKGSPAWTPGVRGSIMVERARGEGVSIYGELETGARVSGEIWDGGRRGYLVAMSDGVETTIEW